MKILDSETLDPTKLSAEEQFYAYNGLDCMVTLEVLEALKPKFLASPSSNESEAGFAYDMARTMQAPSFDATRRGVKIDLHERASRISELENARARCLFIFDKLSAVWEASININSPVQLLEFFYTTLQLKPILIYDRITKQTKPSTNREALEKLQKIERAKPFVDLILAVRDIDKQLQVLRTGIDNGRIHCSYNVCGTLTGRWSSSKSPWGSGTNLQNINDRMRRIFVADPGYKLCQLDLAQAESKVVAYLCLPWGDNYLRACNSGDLHSLTCKLVWPQLPWGTAPDKIIAEQKYYREHSYRDIAKKGGHGCLTEDHEVLTPNGWVPIKYKPREIMAFDRKGTLQFEECSNWVDKAYEGQFIEYDDQAFSIKMTADHKVLGTTDHTQPLSTYRADRLPKSVNIPKGWGWVGGSQKVRIARLLAAFHSNGYQKSTGTIEFHLHKERKILRLRKIAKELGYEVEDKVNNKYTISISVAKEKSQTWPSLEWDKESLEAYLDEYPHWDGHFAETSVSICSMSLDFIDRMQTLYRLLGKEGNLSSLPVSNGSFRKASLHKLQINNRRFVRPKRKKVTEEILQVFCPTVPSGFFLIRRNGRISVTGNSNYYGQPATISQHLKVPTVVGAEFQRLYFKAFPEIPEWHNDVKMRLVKDRFITSPWGRRCHFPGRPWDGETIRSAIAYAPQSAIGDTLNRGYYKLWRRYDPGTIQILTQVHDSILFQYREDEEADLIPLLQKEIVVALEINGQICEIQADAKVGWNWGKRIEYKTSSGRVVENEWGLTDFHGRDLRSPPKKLSMLDRRVC